MVKDPYVGFPNTRNTVFVDPVIPIRRVVICWQSFGIYIGVPQFMETTIKFPEPRFSQATLLGGSCEI